MNRFSERRYAEPMRALHRATLAGVALVTLPLVGCGVSGSDTTSVSTSTSAVRPEADQRAPWQIHGPIPASGTNAEILLRFPSEDAGTCRPMGTEPAIWSPAPGDRAGFFAPWESGDGSPQTSDGWTRVASEWATTFADGSVAYVDVVPAGRLFFVVTPTPMASRWCVYAFTIPQGASYKKMLASVRYLNPD